MVNPLDRFTFRFDAIGCQRAVKRSAAAGVAKRSLFVIGKLIHYTEAQKSCTDSLTVIDKVSRFRFARVTEAKHIL